MSSLFEQDIKASPIKERLYAVSNQFVSDLRVITLSNAFLNESK